MLMSYIPGIIGNYALNLNQPGTIYGSRRLGTALGRARIHCCHASARREPPGLSRAGRRHYGRSTPPPPAPRRNPVGGPPPHPAACLPDAWQRPIVSDARRWIWGVKENILNYSPFLASLIIESKDIP